MMNFDMEMSCQLYHTSNQPDTTVIETGDKRFMLPIKADLRINGKIVIRLVE